MAKKILSLVFALALVLSLALSASADTAVPAEVADGTVVWDMEHLPASFDGLTASLFTELWGSEDGVALGNVIVSASADKGYNGSAALAWKLHQHAFGNNIYVNYSGMEGSKTDWTGATEVYFYIDTTEVGADMPVDLMMNHTGDTYGMVKEAAWYTYSEGAWVEQKINEWGHMVMPANYVGWVRVPLATMGAQPEDIANVSRLCFYTEHSVVDATVYFDHITINVAPPSGGEDVGGGETEVPDDTNPKDGDIFSLIVALAAVSAAGAAIVLKKKF